MRLSITTVIFLFIWIKTLSSQYLVVPDKNYVNADTTAVKIALAIAVPIYGDKIYQEMPFQVTLIGDSVWVVTGTLPESYIEIIGGDSILHVTTGGVAYIKLKKSDGQILSVTHGK